MCIIYIFLSLFFSALQSESGYQNHNYLFDSFSNRLKKDKELHEHNALNQTIKKGNEKLTYDSNGNLTQYKEARYSYDALDRLIQVDTNGSITSYTYDPFNRRLSKKQDGQEQLFLYQGQEEIGSWSNGSFNELRLLNNSSRNPTAAIELNGIPYVPLHDIAGNIICLLNLQGNVVERYRYTAYGEAEILSPSGKQLTTSTVNNFYQYASKRLDPETGFIAFGLRYYDPSLGCWICPDPAGSADGPNLYAYVHNNPWKYFDQWGLFAEDYDLSWDPVFPNYYIASFDYSYHGFVGALHGGFDFTTNQVAGIGSMCCTIGAHEYEWEDRQDRLCSTVAFSESCTGHLNRFDRWFTDTLHVDPANSIYQNFRTLSNMSLEIGSSAIGGCGLAKGGINFLRLSRLPLAIEGAEFAGNLALKEVQFNARQSLFGTLEARIAQLESHVDVNALSRAGQVLDRNWLTKAGRALDKHGGRRGSTFPKATGNTANKNLQGQFQLEDILTHPSSTVRRHVRPKYGEVIDIQIPGDRGVRFSSTGEFIMFLEP